MKQSGTQFYLRYDGGMGTNDYGFITDNDDAPWGGVISDNWYPPETTMKFRILGKIDHLLNRKCINSRTQRDDGVDRVGRCRVFKL